MKILTKEKTEITEGSKILQQLDTLKREIAQTKAEADRKAEESRVIYESLKPMYMDQYQLEERLKDSQQPSLF